MVVQGSLSSAYHELKACWGEKGLGAKPVNSVETPKLLL